MMRNETSSPTSILSSAIFGCFHRTGDVALEDEVEFLYLAGLKRLEEVFEASTPATLRKLCVTFTRLTCLGDLACGSVLFNHEERITSVGN